MALDIATSFFFWFTLAWGLLFFLLYLGEWRYIFLSFKRMKNLNDYKPKKNRRFAIVIPARNESITVGVLIDSIKNQKYEGKIDIYLVADNCTDNRDTYNIGLKKGVTVLERFNNVQKGGNFAIQHALRYIRDNNLLDNYDCFCSFDADNVLDENWVSQVNKTYDYYNSDVVTSYRNSKNYADNWISSAYSIQFIKESDLINKGRHFSNHSTFVNGTGFSFTKKILEETNWWDFNSLSHDIEFTQWLLVNNKKCNYSEKSIFYDEQPIKFKDSWKQRMRWTGGFNQVWSLYRRKLLKSFGDKNVKKYPLYINFSIIFPVIYTFLINIILYVITSSLYIASYELNYKTNPILYFDHNFQQMIYYIVFTPVSILGTIILNFLIQGIIIVSKNKNKINATKLQRIWSVITYPFFMITYIPISIGAIFKRSFSTKPIARKTN